MARHFGGEIVACDSTAVYRGFDIGTDKVPPDGAAGHPAPPDRRRRADRGLHGGALRRATPRRRFAPSTRRGRLPIVVGGTGFYFRALTRGPVSRAGRRRRAARPARARAARRGDGALHRWLGRVDPASAARIQPRDRKRHGARARGLLPHRPAADRAFRRHRVAAARCRRARGRRCGCRRRCSPSAWPGASTRSSPPGSRPRCAGCWRAACRATARPFGGLVYRQMIEYMRGRARARRDARAHRAGEPPLRPPPVDLVPQRAYSECGLTVPARRRQPRRACIDYLGTRGLHHHRSDAGDG